MIPEQTPLVESSLHPWAPQCGSRHPVKAGAEARGMGASHRGGEADLESVWPGSSGPFCNSGDITMSTMVVSDSSGSTGAGCHGTDLVKASSVRLPPIALLPGVLERGRRLRGPAAALKWSLFTSWCGDHQLDPVNCRVGTVLEFL